MVSQRCGKCGHEIPVGTRFCGRCGAPAAEEGPAPSPAQGRPATQPVCPGCGLVAPAEAPVCERCQTALNPRAPSLVARPEGGLWAFLECVAVCPGCRAALPLRPGDVGVAVACGRCGQQASVELSSWHEALQAAHGVADLAGPDPEARNVALARNNPHGLVGVRQAYVTWPAEGGMHGPLRLRLSTGHPLCGRCKTPLEVKVSSPGRVATTCHGCGDRDMFVTPEALRRTSPDLVAVLAPPTDGDQGRVYEWWALFQGPSGLRHSLEARAAREAEVERERREQAARAEREAQEQAARAERERREREARDRAAHEEMARRAQAERERLERERLEREAREAREARERKTRALLVTLLVAGLVLIGLVAAAVYKLRGPDPLPPRVGEGPSLALPAGTEA